MNIRAYQASDRICLSELVAAFRDSLAELRGTAPTWDIPAACIELDEYQRKDYPIFVAEEEDARLTGYMVCRVEGDVVWVESLFVLPEHRRRGVAGRLYARAERLTADMGSDAPYNWVDPGNTAMVAFLQKRGYNVLNLVELRRAQPGESLPRKLHVGRHTFFSQTGDSE